MYENDLLYEHILSSPSSFMLRDVILISIYIFKSAN